MASSQDELLAKQSQLMGSISRALSNFKKLGQAKMKAVVQSRIAALKEKFSTSRDLDAKIRASLDVSTAEELPYYCNDQFEACEDQFDEALDYMSEVLAKVSDNDEVDLNVSHASNTILRPTAQLPRINLPTFNGSFDRWESFRDRFKSMIIDNRTLSNVDRMHYLCSSLSGDASSALTHLAITDANFTVAWNLISSRYENKRRLINGHLQTLFSLPQIASETFKDLQNLRDKANTSVQALKNLDRPVDTWSDILVFLISQKLDKSSRKAWELQMSETVDYPTYNELDKFLESRIRAFEAISPSKSEKTTDGSQKSPKSKSIASHSTTAANLACPMCKSAHLLYQCASFLAYTPSQRYEYVKKENRCINCFGRNHSLKDCKNVRSCKTCHKRHHTLLHFTDDAKSPSVESVPTVASKASDNDNEIASHLISKTIMPKSTVLLATARVRVYSPQGQFVYARALLDQGSVATLISGNIVQRLRLAKIKQTTRITGIGDSQSLSHSVARIRVTPSFGDKPAYSTTAYVIQSPSKYAPNRAQSTLQWAHISDLTLADKNPMSSDPIDLIIGADLYGMLILDGVRKGADNEPIAQNTTLGWIISGPISSARSLHPDSVHANHGTILENLDLDLRKFWEIEEVPYENHLSPEERQCEEHFAATHSRTPEGRYVVRLPFKNGPPIDIGESRATALSSLYRAERRLLREPNKAALYREFLEEYEKLGHMTKVNDTDAKSSNSQIYYIPHHAVFRESSVTTQLRVVFNASCVTSNGTSLNHHLLIGRKLQNNLVVVILPCDLLEQWREYHNQLPRLKLISIPRWTNYGPNIAHCELHGFSDASTKAYAAVVYLRLVPRNGPVTVCILVAKSKVAPIKTLSVPRLELCGAVLLARLMSFVLSNLDIQNLQHHCWTDSRIVLAWLKQPPSRWKVFVANRVAKTQSLLPAAIWHHVPTADNPADCASRGLRPGELADCTLWWSGPSWLKQSPEHWPTSCSSPTEAEISSENRVVIHACVASVEPWDLATRYSSWSKLLTVTAYIMRFTRILRSRLNSTPKTGAEINQSLALTPREIHTAKIFWLKTIQGDLFPQETASLKRNERVPKSSSLVALNPYLDTDGLIRVGGRLQKSDLPESTKHPIVLASHPLLSRIILHAHHNTLHGGPHITLAYLRTEFWLLRARTTVRAVLYRCVKCAREKAMVPAELMGNLPDVRVNRSSRAFEHTGVDYAGPILVRSAKGRGHKAHKAYISLFICMTTKAIHLELVSDYSSAAFLAAFTRFVARRGLPHSMYSDNGTTFQGAERELAAACNAAVRDPNFLNKLAGDQIAWHFLPPAAPHFGGLWEAGVRSVKYHLKRCIGSHTLTCEEMITLLCRVEACLNSRPITSISDSLDDYRALTPGHFLIGANLVAIPEPSVLDITENRLSRWQLVQRISEGFWRSWVGDYLHTLQQRPKWRVVQNLATVGRIVLMRNPLAPPSHWELGRIIACHPGEDGLTRVVTVKTARSEYKRPIVKLCFLPIDINTETEGEAVKAGGSRP